MKKILWSLAALICAVAVFSGTIVYSSNTVSVLKTASEPDPIEDDFFQEGDFFIGDLLLSSNSDLGSSSFSASSDTSSLPNSKAESSSDSLQSTTDSSKPNSSKPSSSKPSSSKPSSSKPNPSKPSSGKPSSSSQSSDSSSSKPEYGELLELVAGAVQREIVGVNTQPSPKYYQAYKAQAIACHSYMEYHKANTGTYPPMSYTAPTQKTRELVLEVLDKLMYYNGSVINASYHAASGGHTQSASYVWGYNVPYLRGVESKYDDYNSTSTLPVDTVRQKLEDYGILVTGEPSSWFDIAGATSTDGGFVNYIEICSQMVKGRTLRETILGTSILKSAKIIDIQVSGDDFIFTTKGYGHGSGMSQQGALGYSANEGWSYQEILTHYYTGITIK